LRDSIATPLDAVPTVEGDEGFDDDRDRGL
jgi:hypothetical protein